MLAVQEEFVVYDAADLAEMNPLYAAYVRAHGMQVPRGRTDLYEGWMAAKRQEFFGSGSKGATPSDFRQWVTSQ